ncbi:hypothetical protein M8J76_009738 [Diaphorina citri]|nr:hypothetical protein M8J75_005278 [Diaphorina citri]KAI5737063.1 hypothetical protein M8J76_009738 [Diaphorina citri]KAI5741847.1 hypothetical protein M8J77_000382 [Diaphorina citri]
MTKDFDRTSLMGRSISNIYSIFSTGYFSSSSENVLMQDAISDSSFLCLILGISCLYFLALSRLIANEKRQIKNKFQAIVESVSKLNEHINILDQMIGVMKDTNKREVLFMKPRVRLRERYRSS